MKKPQSVRLKRDEINDILSRFKPSTQAYRITSYLLNKRQVATGELCAQTSTGNISHIVHTACNPRLKDHGLMIRCHLPKQKIMNQFLQKTLQNRWGVYRIDEIERGSMAG